MAAIQTYRDYIDMEITSSSNSPSDFFCNYSINCSPTRKNREFEFQTDSKNPNENKGKILPLHLFENTKKDNSATTQLYSCNNIISPSESRRHSQDEYFFEWSIEFDDDSDQFDDSKKHSQAKKVNKMKKFALISQKLKASREYFKLLFNKSSCKNDTCATTQVGNVSSRKISRSKRRSSSSSISSSGSSSFSLSSSSSGFQDIQSLRRRIGLNSENENSIEGAIAHCKQSRLISRTCSFSAASRISTFGDYQRSELCYIY